MEYRSFPPRKIFLTQNISHFPCTHENSYNNLRILGNFSSRYFINYFLPKYQNLLIRVNKIDLCTFWYCRQPPPLSDRKFHIKGPSAVPALSSPKFPTRNSPLWSLPAPPHTSIVQSVTHNRASNLPDNKRFKQMW